MKAAWRCLLPPLSEFAEAAPLHCLRLDARGAVQERIEVSLAELARRRQGLPVALFLHPRDCRLVSLELPALPAAKLAAAVNCAAEALVLGDPAQLRLAHGPRGADGRLTLGWLEASALASLEQAVQRLRLDVREVQAAPFLLPLRDDAWVAGEWDGHLLLRRSLSDAVVHPLPEQGLAEVPQELRLFWLGERPAWRSAALERAEALDEALRWSGPASPWGLALKAPATSAGNGTWKMPLICAALALLVWVAGLNLYAGQLAEQGQSCNGRAVNACSRPSRNCRWCSIRCARLASDATPIWPARPMAMPYRGWPRCCMAPARRCRSSPDACNDWTTTPANWTWSCCRDRQAAMPLPGRASWASTGCRPMPPTRAGRCAPWKRRQRRPLARQTVALPRRLPMKMNKRLAGLLNTPAQRWSPLLLRLQAYWRQLAPRERKILAGGGLALCLALTWQVFIDPPLARIEHWQANCRACVRRLRRWTACCVRSRRCAVRP